jgi:tripartite-type tricarboxylate transporter receptor subunit TctC
LHVNAVVLASRRISIAWGLGIALVASLLSESARSAGVEEFYKGRTVSLIIGYSVGGGYDVYARLLARHMGQYIPGRPNIVPQNVTGAGSLRAATYLIPSRQKTGACLAPSGAPSLPLRC